MSDRLRICRHHSSETNTFKDPLTQKLPILILFGLINEVIVQQHVKTPRRYGDDCCVRLQTWLENWFSVILDARLPRCSCKSQKA